MANYPTPDQSGPQYLRFLKVRKDWQRITRISQYEDSGIDTNESAANTVQEWEFEYDGLSDDDAVTLDNFWDTHRLSQTFTLIEPRDHPWTGLDGDTVTGCRFISYEKDHRKVKFTQSRRVVIGKYPT